MALQDDLNRIRKWIKDTFQSPKPVESISNLIVMVRHMLLPESDALLDSIEDMKTLMGDKELAESRSDLKEFLKGRADYFSIIYDYQRDPRCTIL